ncbi:calcium calmodulin-dependent protein kinase type 1G [Phlyctochytrium planicorne]|nr:calcium calmodulin-dependent protein kinase type 1G [Phlyctochytrium planicorne]
MITKLSQLLAKYDLAETLGTGAFSEVKVAIDRSTGNRYAIKIVDKSKCKGKESMIETEVSILMKVRHENIIRLHEMYEIEGRIYLVMELVTGGELFDDIVARGKYSEADTARIVQRILCAVDYLHEMGIAHRDLKPENLLLSDKTPNAKVMISDFGLSKIFNDDEVMRTACGTPGYVAPEVLKRQGYGKEIDLWSLGVITYILLCGYPPFYDQNNVELFKQIMAGRYEFDRPWWDAISETAKDFIRHLLVLDPRLRSTARTALSHPFIVEHCGQTNLSSSQPLRTSITVPDPVHIATHTQPRPQINFDEMSTDHNDSSASNSARSSRTLRSSTNAEPISRNAKAAATTSPTYAAAQQRFQNGYAGYQHLANGQQEYGAKGYAMHHQGYQTANGRPLQKAVSMKLNSTKNDFQREGYHYDYHNNPVNSYDGLHQNYEPRRTHEHNGFQAVGRSLTQKKGMDDSGCVTSDDAMAARRTHGNANPKWGWKGVKWGW